MIPPISKVYNQDNKAIKHYPDNHFDLVFIDAPYGIDAPNMTMGALSKKNKSKNSTSAAIRLKKAQFSVGSGKLKNRKLNTMKLDWDVKPKKSFWKEAFRISKNQIIFGGNYYDLPPTRCIGCWDKVQVWDNFSQWEMIWTSFDAPAFMYRKSNKGGDNKELKIHPTQKPPCIYEYLIMKFAKPGDTILDTHLGSGSSRIAAYKMGFDFYAYEKSKFYFDAQETRFKAHKPMLDQHRNFNQTTGAIEQQLQIFKNP